MKIFKKVTITALLMTLCFIMMLGSASAHNFTDVTRYEDAIGLLSSLEVIKGYTETRFGPEDPVTRWQMALLISKLITGDVETSRWDQNDNSSSFTDVKASHYFGSIAYAHRQGIIIGRSDEVFAPEDPITLQDGLTMVVRALGYPSADLNSGYPESYINKGRELGLLVDINDLAYTANMTRGHTAQLLYNALYANTQSGEKLVEKVFEIVERTLVLTATENMKINSNVSYAKGDTLVFSQMDDFGRFTADAFTLPASAFNLMTPNEYLGVAYRVLSTKDFSIILELEQISKLVLESKTANLTVNENNKTITLGDNTYSPVAGFRSYKLDRNVVPLGTKEIIIYGINGTVVMTNEIAGSTAYYKMTAFDDNDDGYIDRALYYPYSFGRYMVDSSNKVLIAGNELTSALRFTGVTVRHEDYVVYLYNPQSKTLDILKVFTIAEGKINQVEYTSAQGILKIDEATFNVGRKELKGVELKSDLEKALIAVTAGTLQGKKIKYIAEDTNLYWYELGETESNLPNSTTSYGVNIGVVSAVPQYNSSYGYYTVPFATATSSSTTLPITMVDGTTLNSASTNVLNKGDMVQYDVNSTIGNVTTYKLTKINAVPTYNTLTSSAKISVNSNNILTIEENNTNRQYTLSSMTPIYYLDTNMTIANYTGSTFGEKVMSTYYSLFMSYDSTNSVCAVFIKPFDANTVVGKGEFNKIVYISQASLDAPETSSITGYRTYTALDMMTGTNINVHLNYTTVPGVTYLVGAGYYRVYNDIIANVYPVTENSLTSSTLIMTRDIKLADMQNIYESYIYRVGNTPFSTNKAIMQFYVQEGSAINGYTYTKYSIDSSQFATYLSSINTKIIDIIYTKNNNDYGDGTYYGPVVIIVKN
jgi:S-layer homology domain.